jgi:heme/copper-type cytochrome/quinol oxidase subunit 4
VPELFPAIVYFLCFATSSACAWLLGRSYWSSGARLLLWSALCFVFLAANNLLVFFDLLVIRDIDLRLGRLIFALAAVSILLFGFIWEAEEER